MAMPDVSRLENIFRMLTPADVLGNQRISLGKLADSTVAAELQRLLFNNGANGALTISDLKDQLQSIVLKASDPNGVKLFNRVIRLYSSDGPLTGDNIGKAQYMAKRDKVVVENVSFSEIIGNNFTIDADKKMSVILSNSTFLSPATRNADKVETFISSIPSIVMSRCVPYLEIEFIFDRPPVAPLQTASLLKFLLGSPPVGSSQASDMTSAKPGTADGKMTKLHRILDPKTNRELSTANMELFTSPQTLVNMNQLPQGSRYTNVLDPFRPLASIQSFVINIAPTVGLYSYKKGSLSLKLHDRSRLSEISDLIRPQIFTDTTVWVTYGWRHPDEHGNPYADFINNNMLSREAYGVSNSSYAFDQQGQVDVTLELYTKSVTELRTIRIPDSGDNSLAAFNQIKVLAQKVSEYKRLLNIDAPEGPNREIRALQIIDSAERGTFPDFSSSDIKQAIDSLDASFKSRDAKIDSTAARGLIAALKELYKVGNNKNFDFKNRIKTQATNVVKEKFNQITSGVDPFLPSTEKWNAYKSEAGLDNVTHPFLELIERYNHEKPNDNLKGFIKNSLVSFGKLFTVFAGQSIMSVPNIDELQVFFYPFNDKAGRAAATNIAEFPIDMPVFLDQYREHVERKGSERITLEEFLQLVIAAQIDDHRAVGYGFRELFEPYDGRTGNTLKKGKDDTFEKLTFVKPVIEMYVETVYKSNNGRDTDLLRQFETRASDAGSPNSGRIGDMTRIMRMHIFDKQAHPYKLASKLLRSDVGGNPAYIEVANDFADAHSPDEQKQLATLALDPKTKLDSVVQQAAQKGTIKVILGGTGVPFGNDDVKRIVSKMMPTIVYGTNASAVISANLSSKQDPLLSATQMLGNKAGRPSPTAPNGSGVGGIPLRIIPASMSMTTLGCPLFAYAQLFFVDFNSGTTVDNIYNLTGLTHTISPGRFETNLTLTYADGYGRYENVPSVVDFLKNIQVPQPKK